MNPICNLISLATLALATSACSTYPSMDAAAKETLWRGGWKSSEVPLVSGTIVAALPQKLPKNVDFPVRARIRYSSFSLYRSGDVVDATFQGRLSESGGIEGSNQTAPISGRIGGGLLLSLKGRVSDTNQVLSYQASVEDRSTEISGSYRSASPYDLGTFSIKPME